MDGHHCRWASGRPPPEPPSTSRRARAECRSRSSRRLLGYGAVAGQRRDHQHPSGDLRPHRVRDRRARDARRRALGVPARERRSPRPTRASCSPPPSAAMVRARDRRARFRQASNSLASEPRDAWTSSRASARRSGTQALASWRKRARGARRRVLARSRAGRPGQRPASGDEQGPLRFESRDLSPHESGWIPGAGFGCSCTPLTESGSSGREGRPQGGRRRGGLADGYNRRRRTQPPTADPRSRPPSPRSRSRSAQRLCASAIRSSVSGRAGLVLLHERGDAGKVGARDEDKR
jgi:hypothetical protein